MTFPPPRSGRSPTEPPPISNIPEQGLPFNGRDEQIARLTKLFRQYGHVLLHDAESGHGFGKTQMAIAYCWRFTLRYDVVWWFKCSDETDDDRLLTLIETQEQELLELCAQTLGGPPKPRPDSRWLFVYDNVSDPDRIYEHFVPGAGHRLVISRTKGLTWGRTASHSADSVRRSPKHFSSNRPRASPANRPNASRAAPRGTPARS
ncbi:hypothetical protein F3K43_33725 [Streptomyces sp. LBUM 1476]|nr:hypothetical protein [Streptomyces sp. LBUM 1476]